MNPFAHHGHYRSPLAKLKRRATYLLAVLIVAAAGYLALSAWGDYSITGVTTGIPGDEASKEFVVSAALALPESGFDVRDVTLKITLGSAEETFSGGTLLIDGLNMESFQGASLVLNGYDGHVASTESSVIQLDGKATSAIVNNIVINKGGTPIAVETKNLRFDSAIASGVSAKSFSIVSTGKVDVADKGSFSVDDEKIEIKSFNGVVELDNSGLKLTGSAGNLLIEGTPRISVK